MQTEVQSIANEKKQLELELGATLEAMEWFGLNQQQQQQQQQGDETKDATGVEQGQGLTPGQGPASGQGQGLAPGQGQGLAPGLTAKEEAELREMLARKETAIEQLLEYLAEEERARTLLEQSSRDMLVDYHKQLDTLQRHNEALSRQVIV